MRGHSRATATGQTIWCRTLWAARLSRNNSGSPGLISGPGCSRLCIIVNVNNVRRDIRDSSGLDIEHVSATLTATTDPTATRKMFELERALAQLPLQQQVILLVGLEGISYEDTAGILMIRVGTVRSRLSRGRDALRKLLDMEERCFSAALPQAA